MASDPANLPKPDQILTAQVCDLFLDHSERHNEPATYLGYKYFLQSFTDLYGRVPAGELKPIHVTRWLDAHRGVGIAQVAELLGHTDTRMVSKHYGHLSQKVQ